MCICIYVYKYILLTLLTEILNSVSTSIIFFNKSFCSFFDLIIEPTFVYDFDLILLADLRSKLYIFGRTVFALAPAPHQFFFYLQFISGYVHLWINLKSSLLQIRTYTQLRH